MNCRKITTKTIDAAQASSKKVWETPRVMDLEVEVIRQEAEEYYRMIEDPQLFQKMMPTNPDP